MMRRSFVLLIALCVAGGLGVAWLRSFSDGAESEIVQTIARARFASIDAIDISGPFPVQLACRDSVWRVGSGRPADKERVQELLQAIASVGTTQEVALPAQKTLVMAQQDLKTQVQVFCDGRMLANFFLGAEAGLGTFLAEDARLYRVPTLFAEAFRHPSNEWTDRTIFQDEVQDVAALNVALAESEPYALTHDKEKWSLLSGSTPRGYRFDSMLAARMADALLGLTAENLLDIDPGNEVTGLGAGADTLTYTFTEQAARRTQKMGRSLRLGKKRDDGQVYAQVEGASDVFTLQSYVVAGFRKSLSGLRDTTLLAPFKPEDVLCLSLRDGTRRVQIARTEKGFVRRSYGRRGRETPLDKGRVAARLRILSSLRGVLPAKFARYARRSIGPSKGQLSVALRDGTKTHLTFGADSGQLRGETEGFYVLGDADDTVYVVPRGLKESLLGNIESLRAPPSSR